MAKKKETKPEEIEMTDKEMDEYVRECWKGLKEVLEDVKGGCPSKRCKYCKMMESDIDIINSFITDCTPGADAKKEIVKGTGA